MPTLSVDRAVFDLEGPGGPTLIGSCCRRCGTHNFPATAGCPCCTGADTEEVALATTGTLWTWTIQGYPPKSPPYLGPASPEEFVPYGVGYVELPEQLRVETRLVESTPDSLRIGMPMELVAVPLATDLSGMEVMTFAFRGVGR